MGPLLVALSSLLHSGHRQDSLSAETTSSRHLGILPYSSKIDLGSNSVEMMAVRGLDGCLNFRVDKPPPPFGRSPTYIWALVQRLL